MKLKIQGKLLLYILTTVIVIYSVAFVYIFNAINKDAKANAQAITEKIAEKYSITIEQKLNSDFKVVRTLSNTVKKYPELNYSQRKKIFDPVLKETLESNPHIMSVWYTWELNTVYPQYLLPYGRTRIAYYSQQDISAFKYDSLDINGDNVASTYYKIKINPQEVIVNPYYGNYTNRTEDNILMTTLAVPIFIKGRYAGLTGIDIALEQMQQIAEEIINEDKSFHSFMVAPNNKFVSFSGKKLADNEITSYFTQKEAEIISGTLKLKSGKNSFISIKDKKEYYITVIPIKFGKSETSWAVGVMAPVSDIMNKVKKTSAIFFMVTFAGIIILIYIIWLFSVRITNPLKKTAEAIINLSKGNISDTYKLKINSKDEIAEIGKSVNNLIDSLNKTAAFAVEIGKGNLDYEYTPLSRNDILGNSLLGMRESLKQAKNDEFERQETDRKLNWATQGSAKFADIMRQYSDNLENLAYAVISELVKYIEANQGGVFLINEDPQKNKSVDLIASYAYDKRKMLKKKIPFGVGLIGRAILERETIYMTKIPSEYINITSGLGEDTPKQLLIVPLIFNDEVFGVVELASFKQIQDYQISFVEKIGEVIASTLSMVKINIRTAKLLEETKLKSEEMSAQEEEIRQNVEEMKSSQEELNNQVTTLTETLNAVKAAIYMAEFDMQGKIIDINDKFLELLGKNKKEVVGKFQGSFNIEEQSIENFNKFWERLQSGHIREFTQEIIANGQKISLFSTYVPIMNEYGDTYKVISIAYIINTNKEN